MKPMNYETFVHHVAMEFSGYLPKGLEQYHTLIKADKKGDGRDAHLTIEKDKVEYIRSIKLYPYYLNYQYGAKFDTLLVEMVEELITPDKNKQISMREAPPKRQFCILVIGVTVLCMVAGAICKKKQRRNNKQI